MKQILINEISIEELLIKIGEVIEIKLNQHQHPIAHVRSTYLTRQEARTLLKISLPSLAKYTKKGLLQSYKIASRVLYKTDEVELAIQRLSTYNAKKRSKKEWKTNPLSSSFKTFHPKIKNSQLEARESVEKWFLVLPPATNCLSVYIWLKMQKKIYKRTANGTPLIYFKYHKPGDEVTLAHAYNMCQRVL